MDNLTHSLVGLVAGEAIARTVRADSSGLPAATRRTALLWVSVAGSSLPDIDLLWSGPLGTGDRLGYLLEHRGYTHTVLGCAVLAGLLYVAALLWLRFRSQTPSARDRLTLGIMAALSIFLHLGMDALNSYGVHPFWPWNNRWFYGDALFIVEPLYWLAAAPLLFVWRSVAARVVLALILLVAGVAVLAVHQFALLWWGVSVLALSLALLGKRAAARTAALASVAMMLMVAVGFIASGRLAARRMDALAQQYFPDWVTLDKVLSPIPAHPGCWDVLLVQSRDSRYVVRHALLSIASMPTVSACPQLLAGKRTAPMTPVPVADSSQIRWLGEFTLSTDRLISLVAMDCAAGELMQFARAPFAAEVEQRWVLGDLRFDREAGMGMAEIALDPARTSACQHHVPWAPPRADLLGQSE
jgi:inner membrane protein